MPEERRGETGLAVVVGRPGRPLAAGYLHGFRQGRLARYKQPRETRFVDAIPRNSTGKALKRELQNIPPLNLPVPRVLSAGDAFYLQRWR